jgi:hypothetical protein
MTLADLRSWHWLTFWTVDLLIAPSILSPTTTRKKNNIWHYWLTLGSVDHNTALLQAKQKKSSFAKMRRLAEVLVIPPSFGFLVLVNMCLGQALFAVPKQLGEKLSHLNKVRTVGLLSNVGGLRISVVDLLISVVGLLISAVGLLISAVGLLISAVGLIISVVGLLISVVGILISIVGLLISVAGLLISAVGLLISVVGLLISVVDFLISVVGILISVVGLLISVVGLLISVVGLLISVCKEEKKEMVELVVWLLRCHPHLILTPLLSLTLSSVWRRWGALVHLHHYIVMFPIVRAPPISPESVPSAPEVLSAY